jgi:hypothetical protein
MDTVFKSDRSSVRLRCHRWIATGPPNADPPQAERCGLFSGRESAVGCQSGHSLTLKGVIGCSKHGLGRSVMVIEFGVQLFRRNADAVGGGVLQMSIKTTVNEVATGKSHSVEPLAHDR